MYTDYKFQKLICEIENLSHPTKNIRDQAEQFIASSHLDSNFPIDLMQIISSPNLKIQLKIKTAISLRIYLKQNIHCLNLHIELQIQALYIQQTNQKILPILQQCLYILAKKHNCYLELFQTLLNQIIQAELINRFSDKKIINIYRLLRKLLQEINDALGQNHKVKMYWSKIFQVCVSSYKKELKNFIVLQEIIKIFTQLTKRNIRMNNHQLLIYLYQINTLEHFSALEKKILMSNWYKYILQTKHYLLNISDILSIFSTIDISRRNFMLMDWEIIEQELQIFEILFSKIVEYKKIPEVAVQMLLGQKLNINYLKQIFEWLLKILRSLNQSQIIYNQNIINYSTQILKEFWNNLDNTIIIDFLNNRLYLLKQTNLLNDEDIKNKSSIYYILGILINTLKFEFDYPALIQYICKVELPNNCNKILSIHSLILIKNYLIKNYFLDIQILSLVDGALDYISSCFDFQIKFLVFQIRWIFFKFKQLEESHKIKLISKIFLMFSTLNQESQIVQFLNYLLNQDNTLEQHYFKYLHAKVVQLSCHYFNSLNSTQTPKQNYEIQCKLIRLIAKTIPYDFQPSQPFFYTEIMNHYLIKTKNVSITEEIMNFGSNFFYKLNRGIEIDLQILIQILNNVVNILVREYQYVKQISVLLIVLYLKSGDKIKLYIFEIVQFILNKLNKSMLTQNMVQFVCVIDFLSIDKQYMFLGILQNLMNICNKNNLWSLLIMRIILRMKDYELNNKELNKLFDGINFSELNQMECILIQKFCIHKKCIEIIESKSLNLDQLIRSINQIKLNDDYQYQFTQNHKQKSQSIITSCAKKITSIQRKPWILIIIPELQEYCDVSQFCKRDAVFMECNQIF